MNWLREAINDNHSGLTSSKRVALLFGAMSLSFAVVLLALAACFGRDVANAIWAVSTSLAALSGASYVGGKQVERP